MTSDFILGILIGILLILAMLLTLPIWICYTIYRKMDWSMIKKLYELWLKK